jgi:hypothetical protein
VRQTARLAASWVWDGPTLRGVGAALIGLPWVVRRRRVMPRHVETALDDLHAATAAARQPARG